MDHDASKSVSAAVTTKTPAPLATRRRGAGKRRAMPQWLVVLAFLLVASVVVERAKTPPSPVSASRTTIESWRFNRT